ncbi:hypothetical protein RN001_002943 [Aquatica leii]|uniref:Cytosolic carboxypeptidase N-terminal domain-containing protein n=1 Tax=Aquatica leii TaxID=1421715 RepID=A0AAN7Q926_9COLE|nr:hypothetical protein RN001_002943 [Aquatica leii]
MGTSKTFRSQNASKNSVYEENKSFDRIVLIEKDSEDLFPTIKKYNNSFEPPRWPSECQVLDKKVSHIYYTPSLAEPYFENTGKEACVKPFGKKRGRTVYEIPCSNLHCFHQSCINGSCECTACTTTDDGLRFESRFESGNLAKAVKITSDYYELYIRNDLYTYRQRQWFYFRITNMEKDKTYRYEYTKYFNIQVILSLFYITHIRIK